MQKGLLVGFTFTSVCGDFRLSDGQCTSPPTLTSVSLPRGIVLSECWSLARVNLWVLTPFNSQVERLNGSANVIILLTFGLGSFQCHLPLAGRGLIGYL